MFEGDCKNCIHLWEPSSGGTWNVDMNPFVGHTASVEDLQVCILFKRRHTILDRGICLYPQALSLYMRALWPFDSVS